MAGRPPAHSNWRWAAAGLAAAAAAIAIALSHTVSLEEALPIASRDVRLLVGPIVVHGGSVQLESQSEGIPWLRVTARGHGFEEEDVPRVLSAFSMVLERRKPFFVVWDMRALRWPRVTRAQWKTVRKWVSKNVRTWDAHAQGHAAILSNPIARAFAALMARVFQPPQPLHIGRDLAYVEEFVRRCCLKPRSYVKPAYDDGSKRDRLLRHIGLGPDPRDERKG